MKKLKRHSLYIALVFFAITLATGCIKQNISEIQPISKGASLAPIDEFINLVTFSSNEVKGWKLTSPVKIYDRNTIFDYIDGAAELYLAYDFTKVATAEYRGSQTPILIDVYEMATPESAFGIYVLNRYQEADYVKIGNEGILTDANLDFWKGKYYCKIYALDQSDEYQKVVVDFGNKLASRILESGQEPDIIKKLPQDNLIPKTEKYFTRKLGLDNIHFTSEENVLELDGETKGALAEYRAGDESFRLFVVEYPSPQKALSAFDTYSKYLTKKGEIVGKDPEEAKIAFKIEGKFTCIKRNDNLISGFWDVESEELAKIVLEKAKCIE